MQIINTTGICVVLVTNCMYIFVADGNSMPTTYNIKYNSDYKIQQHLK